MTLDFAGTNRSSVSQKTPTVSRVKNFCLAALLFLITGMTVSCGGFATSGAAKAPTPLPEIAIFPTTVTVASGGVQQFAANLSNTSNTAVIWTASAGTISKRGLFTAPAVTATTQVSVTATSVADTAKQVSATITIKGSNNTPPVSISISPAAATVASSGVQQFTAHVSDTRNTEVSWTASAGTISKTGLFTAPIVTATTQVWVTATSVADASQQASATISVNGATNTPPVSISISPAAATVGSGGAKQFTANVSNTSNTAVTWTSTAGTISKTGLFTAPAVTATTRLSVMATSIADKSKSAAATVTVDPSTTAPPPAIQSLVVPNAIIGQPYDTRLLASGGQSPYHWGITSGRLPQGIQLDSASGAITGTSKTTGSFSFSASVTDAHLQNSIRNFTLMVANDNQPNTIPSHYFGMHFADISTWPAGYVGALGKASAVYWPFVERSRGVYDWSRLDAWARTAEANGTSFYFSNDYVPEWAAADRSTCSPTVMNVTICTSMVANISDWDNFITALVKRYKGKIQMYELWNEPNNSWYFSGSIEQMVTLTNHMYNIIRALDPQALIASPSATDMKWLDSYWAAGGAKTVDIVSTHSYPDPRNPVAEVICAFRSVPLRALMTKYGIQKPIWDTEGSWGEASALGDPDLQAAYVSRHEILNWACGVRRFYWYAWDGGNPAWGLLWRRSAGPTNAGVAYETVENWLNGATMPNSCLVNGSAIPAPPALYHGVYSCDLTRPNGYQAQAVWDTNGPSTYSVPSQFTQYRDLYGHTHALPASREVPIGYAPILLEN